MCKHRWLSELAQNGLKTDLHMDVSGVAPDSYLNLSETRPLVWSTTPPMLDCMPFISCCIARVML